MNILLDNLFTRWIKEEFFSHKLLFTLYKRRNYNKNFLIYMIFIFNKTLSNNEDGKEKPFLSKSSSSFLLCFWVMFVVKSEKILLLKCCSNYIEI